MPILKSPSHEEELERFIRDSRGRWSPRQVPALTGAYELQTAIAARALRRFSYAFQMAPLGKERLKFCAGGAKRLEAFAPVVRGACKKSACR